MGREVVYRPISFQDLALAGIQLTVQNIEGILKVTKITKYGKRLDLDKLPDMLYTLGIVRDHNLEIQDKCQHRTISGKIVEDYRFVGKERNDKEWLKSGYASEEAKISSSKMKDMNSHLRKLSRGGE